MKRISYDGGKTFIDPLEDDTFHDLMLPLYKARNWNAIVDAMDADTLLSLKIPFVMVNTPPAKLRLLTAYLDIAKEDLVVKLPKPKKETPAKEYTAIEIMEWYADRYGIDPNQPSYLSPGWTKEGKEAWAKREAERQRKREKKKQEEEAKRKKRARVVKISASEREKELKEEEEKKKKMEDYEYEW